MWATRLIQLGGDDSGTDGSLWVIHVGTLEIKGVSRWMTMSIVVWLPHTNGDVAPCCGVGKGRGWWCAGSRHGWLILVLKSLVQSSFLAKKKGLRPRLVQIFPKTKKIRPGLKKTVTAVFFSLFRCGPVLV